MDEGLHHRVRLKGFGRDEVVGKLSILVAGSDADIRALILYVLIRQGFEVIEVEDDSVLFDRVLELHPDVVLVDLPWPPDSRLEFIRRLKNDKQLASTPVSVMMMDDRFLSEVIAAGSSAAIRIPDELQQLGIDLRINN